MRLFEAPAQAEGNGQHTAAHPSRQDAKRKIIWLPLAPEEGSLWKRYDRNAIKALVSRPRLGALRCLIFPKDA